MPLIEEGWSDMIFVQCDMYSDIGGRAENEDSLQVIKKIISGKYVFAVADGLGGHGGGKIASGTVMNVLKDEWDGVVTSESWTQLIQKANDQVLKQQTEKCKMKSTLAGLMVDNDHYICAHVGDSRVYHFYNGMLLSQTRDHSASQLAVMMGEITPEEIRFHEARSHVLKAIGQNGLLKPEICQEKLKRGNHAFLLCTDGFWEYVQEPEMTAALAESGDPQTWLKKMRKIAEGRMEAGNDNNTAVVVFLKKI